MRAGLLLSSVTTVCTLVAGCSKPSNSNFPGKPENVPTDSKRPSFSRWSLLMKELRVDDGLKITKREGEGGYVASLAKPSEFFTSSDPLVSKAYQNLLASAATDFIKNAPKTRCAGVVSVRKISKAFKRNALTNEFESFDGADVYLMKYKLFSDGKGNIEPDVRSGILSMPTDLELLNKAAPLVAYAHGGDSGISPREIASAFGDLQATHVITAPTFPGEALCKTGTSSVTTSCNEDGKYAEALPKEKSPYFGDTHELLAMHDCAVKAARSSVESPYRFPIVDANDKETGEDLAISIAKIAKPIDGSGPYATFPVAYMVGASRGSMTAASALAQAGAALSIFDDAEKKAALGANYDFPPRFRCSLDLFGPKTFLATEFKVALEASVHGYGENTVFINLPTARQFNEKWKNYGNGISLIPGKSQTDAENAKLAAVELVKIDVPLLAPLIFSSLKNWADPANSPGGLFTLHGMLDKVVPVSQSLFSSTLLQGINQKLTADDASGNAD